MNKAHWFIGRFLILAVVIGTALWLAGCETAHHQNTMSLLSAAGFRTFTPSTPEQQASFAALPPFQLQRRDFNGQVVYAFADKNDGIVYVGNEQQYQRFRQLGHEQRMADSELRAAQMNQNAAMHWNFWGPPGVAWWY